MKRLYTETEEIKITRKKTYIDVDDSYTQMYDSLGKLLVMCKSIHEVNLMFFASINSNNGLFTSNENFFNKFNNYLLDNSGNTITRKTFTTTISNLVKKKILIKSSRGEYQLNPILIWREDTAKRTEQVLAITQLPVKDKLKYLIESKPFKDL